MERRFRLTKNEAIKRVRKMGHTYVHRAVVLEALPNQLDQNRIAVIASQSVGGAVKRNLAKRRIRSILHTFLTDMEPGFDLAVVARKPVLQEDYDSLRLIVRTLLEKAGLLKEKVID